MGYKEHVLNSFPNLTILDNKEITREHRDTCQDYEKYENKAELFFKPVKIVGLPAPPKEVRTLVVVEKTYIFM